jgi:NAD(P) transhydrogenase subunit alpha
MPLLSTLSLIVLAEASGPHEASGQLIALITIFVLAIFVGFEIITKVPPTLHTPLMSGSNVISGITIVGALIIAAAGAGWITAILAFLAITLAMINVVGGYLVTHRMLRMFKKKKG